MTPMDSADRNPGTTLPQAALIAGVGLLVMTVTAPVAEFYVYPKLIVPGSIDQTSRNIQANQGLFLAGVLCYLIAFICDVLVAWALYVFLRPVNTSVSLLTAWFRLVYTVIALFALLNLVTVLRLLNTPNYLTLVGSDQLYAQVRLLLDSFRDQWGIGFVFFGIHLGTLGYLVYRSGYIPKILGILLTIAGLGYLIDNLSPYLLPNADLRFLMITFFGELIFMLWLLIRGSKIEDPTRRSSG
jgi:hypothetical protein